MEENWKDGWDWNTLEAIVYDNSPWASLSFITPKKTREIDSDGFPEDKWDNRTTSVSYTSNN